MRCCYLILWGAIFSCALGEEGIAETNDDSRGHFAYFMDNDLVFGEDQGYTSGLRLAWLKEVRSDKGRSFAGAFFPDLGSSDETSFYKGVSLTHLIFTPDNPFRFIPPLGERQYAGWLGLGFSIHQRSGDFLQSWELSIGTTGPASFAEEAQDAFHRSFGGAQFIGWEFQVPAEVTLNLDYLNRRRYEIDDLRGASLLGSDLYVDYGASLGNRRTDLSMGLVARVGLNLEEDFSDNRLSNTAYHHESEFEENFSIYTLIGAKFSLVFHEISLDGPVFREAEIFNERETVVVEFLYGVGLRYREIDFIISGVRRSREFKDSDQSGQNFGSATLRFSY